MRLIDADELMDYFVREGELWHYTGIISVLENAETLCSVRCADCKHFILSDIPLKAKLGGGYCKLMNHCEMDSKGFCAFGEATNETN